MFPTKFVERIHKLLPEKEWDLFFAKATQPLPKTVRTAKDFKFVPPEWTLIPAAGAPNTYFIKRTNQDTIPLGRTIEHFTGKFYVASQSSLLPPLVLNPSERDSVLDLCAAPGSKTTLLSEYMDNQGLLIANEPSSSRAGKLVSNLERMGVMNTVVLQYDGTKLSNFFGQQFTKILLDAPCSSEGFARKDSKFFETMWSEKKIFEAAKLQKQLIITAFEMLAPEGEMVYSTCTSAPEENEAVVEHLMKKYGKYLELVPVAPYLKDVPHRSGVRTFFSETFDPQIAKNTIRIWPHLESAKWSGETFFIAKIRKLKAIEFPPQKKSLVSRPIVEGNLSVLKKNQAAEITVRLHKKFGIPKDTFRAFVWGEKPDRSIWLISADAAYFAKNNPSRRAGLPILDSHGNITTPFAIHFGMRSDRQFVDLEGNQVSRWTSGYDLTFPSPLPFSEGSEVFVRYANHCLGYGKVQKSGSVLKNKLDRDLIMN